MYCSDGIVKMEVGGRDFL